MARTQLFPGQETSWLFVISLGRMFKTYRFDVHECFLYTYMCTPEEGTHRATLIENSGALCGCWECNGGPLSALNHWVTSPDPSLGNYKGIFILNCVYVQVDTCMIAGNQRPKGNVRFLRAGFTGGCETPPRMLRSEFRSSGVEGVLTCLFSLSSRFLKILYSY